MIVVKTDKETRMYDEHFWVSRHSCINYDENEIVGDEPMDDMVEMICREKFKNLIRTDELFIEVVLWCEENCEGLISANPFSEKFDFELEEDAVAFKLIWV